MTAVGIAGGDPDKVDVAGDTMTGALVLPGNPTLPLHAATREWVLAQLGGGGAAVLTVNSVSPDLAGNVALVMADIPSLVATLAAKLALTGGTMTGALVLAGAPAADLQAATKKYVDDLIAGVGGGSGWAHKWSGLITDGPAGSGSDAGYDVTSGGYTTIGPSLTIPAAVGDVLRVESNLHRNQAGDDVRFEAATVVSGSNTRYFSSGTTTPAGSGAGSLGGWYVQASRFTGPVGPGLYTVVNDDISAGNVTVRLLGRAESGSVRIRANPSFPAQWLLVNQGAQAS